MTTRNEMNGKRCPMCNTLIFDWECLCAVHWKQVKLYDVIHGTNYIDDFLAGKKPVFEIQENLAESIKWIKNRRMIILKDICIELCRRCIMPENSMVTGEDKCSKCEWKQYMNYLLSEYIE